MASRRSPSLESEFNDPFDQYVAKRPGYAFGFPGVLEDLRSRLENTIDDWTIRHNALQEAISYLKGTMNQFEFQNFRQLAPGLASCLAEQRSTLVKTSSLFVAAAAMALGQNYVTSVEPISLPLFRQLSNTIAVIAQSCRFALLKLAQFVQHQKTIRMFLANHRSKTAVNRQVVAEAFALVFQYWSWKLLQSLEPEIKTALQALAGDANQQVRQAADHALAVARLQKRTALSEKAQSNLLGEAKSPGKARQKSENDIADYCPPKTESDARCFVRELQAIVKKESFDAMMDIEELLPSAVVSAAEMIPNPRNWQGFLPKLLAVYHDDFRIEIPNILTALKMTPWIIEILVKEFGPHEIINRFRDGSTPDQDLKFFSSLFSLTMEFQMSEELKGHLVRLIRQFPNASESVWIANRIKEPISTTTRGRPSTAS
jgi:hypothetical protein